MSNLKNWWLQIIAIVLVILDLGFEVINPLLFEFGISEKWIGIIKVLFGIIAVVKTKLQMPTLNEDKLQSKVYEIIGGSTPPPNKDEK